MSFYSLLFAASLAAVFGKVIRIKQSRLPLREGSREDTIHSYFGTLRLVQTLQLDDAEAHSSDSEFRYVASLIVKPDGSELLAITEESKFVTVNLWPSTNDKFDVTEVKIDPMYDPQGEILDYESLGGSLAIRGPYSGGGRGDLIVSFSEQEKVLRFPTGIQTRRSVDLSFSDLLPDCGSPDAILSSKRELAASLLMLCHHSTDSGPTPAPGNAIYDGVAFDGFNTKHFYLETSLNTFGDFSPPYGIHDMAELNNGDLMILFVGGFDDKMRIGYVRRDELRQAIHRGGIVRPEIIAHLSRNEGYIIGDATGLDIRQDPRSARIFVYITYDYYDGEEDHVLLSTFEWIPEDTAGRCANVATN